MALTDMRAMPGGNWRNPRKWLRQLHAWCGLAAAIILLFFAVTGFLLNHRSVMQIPALDKTEVRQFVVLEAPPDNPNHLADTLARQLVLPTVPWRVRVEPARTLEWQGLRVVQPVRWVMNQDLPSEAVQAEYWVGSRQVEVKRSKPNLWLHLARLHMSVGVGQSWVVLADCAAVMLAFLSLSGFLLWGRLHGSSRRMALLAAGGAFIVVALGLWAG